MYDPRIIQTAIPPLDRLKSFSDIDFENFIVEWVVSGENKEYTEVYRVGGSGDMGRDVIAQYSDGKCDYFQCKKYGKPLNPSNYWVEFGKLCYHIYNNHIEMPINYYIIASSDIGPKLSKLIQSPKCIVDGLIVNWSRYCEKDITVKENVLLEGVFLEFVKAFDFSIVQTYPISNIIEEMRNTQYFYFRFGGNITPTRTIKIDVPEDVDRTENKYTQEVLLAYSEDANKNITLEMLCNEERYNEDFKYRRIEFYSSESLRRSVRDIFVEEDELLWQHFFVQFKRGN